MKYGGDGNPPSAWQQDSVEDVQRIVLALGGSLPAENRHSRGTRDRVATEHRLAERRSLRLAPEAGRRALEVEMLLKWISLLFVFFLSGCVGIPANVTPVSSFNLEKYLGKWYEIARLDHSFERGLTRVTADYSLREDGGVRVLNRGYSAKEAEWKEAEGRAYFVKQPDQGYLKVSFFGPFYGSYIIFELDPVGYRYSLVCGPDKSYLWILARGPEMDDDLKKVLVGRAATLGFDTDKLIFVKHR